MPLVTLLVVIALIGLVTWALTTYVVKTQPFRNIIIAVAAIGTIIFVLSAFGVLGSLDAVRVGPTTPHRR